MQGMVTFVGHLTVSDRVYAVFNDPQGGQDFVLNHEECQERLGNLRDNNLPYEETEKALLQWPTSAD